MADYLPRRDVDLLAWASNFSQRVSADPGAYGLTAGMAASVAAAEAAFGAAYRVASEPSTRTAPATNHLDLDMRHALEVALQEFAGAVVSVSHDRHLIRATSDVLWLVADGGVRTFDGDLDDYARWLDRREDKSAAVSGGGASAPGTSGDTGAAAGSRSEGAVRRPAKERRRAAADRRAREKALRETVHRLDEQIADERGRLARIEARLADPASYADEGPGGGDIAALMKEQHEVRRRLEAAEDEWLAAAEMLEAKAASS